MHSTCVLASLVLLVGLVQSFPWDIVVGGEKQLEFYYNGTLTHTEVIPTAHQITSVTYDPVHYRVLFTDFNYPTSTSISSFDPSTRKIQPSVMRKWNGYITRLVHDPVTQQLFWKEGSTLYSFSLNSTSSDEPADTNVVVKLERYYWDLAVDSRGGYIYWITDYEIERVRLDGSGRQVLINEKVWLRLSLAIDQQTQKLYWTERTRRDNAQMSIETANLNGKNRETLYIVRSAMYAMSLIVTNDFIYWQNYKQEGIWQLAKNSLEREATKQYSLSSSDCVTCHRIAANYTIQEQIQGTKSRDALQGLMPDDSESESTVSICQNYCFQGECVSAEGRPTCSCKAGYSGDRCEVNACHQYCLNGGVCSLNEANVPVCKCTAKYEGERCEVSAFVVKCIQTVSTLQNMLNADVTSVTLENKGVKSPCAATVV